MPKYNGHDSYNAWNVSLWIGNDEGIYRTAVSLINRCGRDKAAKQLLEMLPEKTPDGVKYSYTTIRKALVGLS